MCIRDRGYPVRIAFVLGDASLSDEASGDVFGDSEEVIDEQQVVEQFHTHLASVGTQVAAACSLAKLARGPKTAWAFLVELASNREYGA